MRAFDAHIAVVSDLGQLTQKPKALLDVHLERAEFYMQHQASILLQQPNACKHYRHAKEELLYSMKSVKQALH